MPIQATFKAAIQRLTELAGRDQPAYVSVRAACKLADLLSPGNRDYGHILHALDDDQTPAGFSSPPQRPEPPTENPCAIFLTDDDEDEDDESEGTNQDDEPP